MTRLLGPIAALLFLAALAALALTTVFFLRSVVPTGMFPVKEFDANAPTTVELENTRYRYVVYAQVGQSRADPPEASIAITDADGNPIELTPNTGWADLLGRYYRRLGDFSVASPQAITITATAEPLEDFAVFHDFGDVSTFQTQRHLPGWIVGGVLLLGSLAALLGFVMTSEKRLQARVAAMHL